MSPITGLPPFGGETRAVFLLLGQPHLTWLSQAFGSESANRGGFSWSLSLTCSLTLALSLSLSFHSHFYPLMLFYFASYIFFKLEKLENV